VAKPIIAIQFPSPAPTEFMHRALNFMEDVYRYLRDNPFGSVDDIDHYHTGQFVVRLSRFDLELPLDEAAARLKR